MPEVSIVSVIATQSNENITEKYVLPQCSLSVLKNKFILNYKLIPVLAPKLLKR